MAKYLHKFDNLSDFTAIYNGSAYTEPWVSFTDGQTGQIVTAFTLYEVLGNDDERYILDKVFTAPETAINGNGYNSKIYGRYLPSINRNNPPAFSTVPLEDIASRDFDIVLWCVDPYGSGNIKTLNWGYADGPFECATGTTTVTDVDYNKKKWRLVASFNGDESLEGFQMDILENTLTPQYPMCPNVDENDYLTDLYCKFIVNGRTVVGGTGLMMFGGNPLVFEYRDDEAYFAFSYGPDFKTPSASGMIMQGN